ncbi:mitochondrial potassium channel isoform 2-T2 [Leptodactylus fuscus]|uniref:mitochondrial potassium channel isoform X2 n=1 Tax=Leptodactylus fuscus TaxID=238119 RepID=UPI003F4E91FC
MRHFCTVHIAIGAMKPPHSPSVLLTQRIKLLSIRTLCSPASKPPDSQLPSEVSGVTPLQRWVETGKAVGINSMNKASATARNWWDRYEEFVGLVEVREAQGKVAEEEKRLRSSYVNAEDSEREKFALFSASVRESHEKERTRAERTKNWSIIGSVLGAIIGVMGSTYINRVRLQELKTLVLEAQKGPISLQEAIHEHASVHQTQQKDLGDLIIALRNMVPAAQPPSQDPQSGNLGSAEVSSGSVNQVLSAIREHMEYSKETGNILESLQQKYGNLEKSLGNIATDMQNVKSKVSWKTPEGSALSSAPRDASLQGVILELSETEQRLGDRINRNSIYSTALTCSMVAISFPILYILLRGN